jgi:hypothetical protein
VKRKPGATEAELIRLRNDYEARARLCHSQAKTMTGDRAAALRGQARAFEGCALDLNDLAQGREHPSARRS